MRLPQHKNFNMKADAKTGLFLFVVLVLAIVAGNKMYEYTQTMKPIEK